MKIEKTVDSKITSLILYTLIAIVVSVILSYAISIGTSNTVTEVNYLVSEKIGFNTYKVSLTEEFTNQYLDTTDQIAWYIYKDGKIVDKISYTESRYFEYTFSENGTYIVSIFIKDKDIYEDIVEIGDVEEFEYFTCENVDSNVYKISMTEEFINNFTTNGDQFAWYIIKDEVAIEKTSYNEEKYIDYEFNETGDYIIQLYIKDKGSYKQAITVE